MVPDYAVAREVPVWPALVELKVVGLDEVDGKNGREFKGVCPFGEPHGKRGCFSINKESGAFMCHACKRHGSHILRFVEVYMETHADDVRFNGTGTQAAARWLVSLVRPIKDEGQGSEDEDVPALLSEYDQGLWDIFTIAVQPHLKVMLTLAKNRACIAELLCETVRELAQKIEK
jgi:CHC2 zinc finger